MGGEGGERKGKKERRVRGEREREIEGERETEGEREGEREKEGMRACVGEGEGVSQCGPGSTIVRRYGVTGNLHQLTGLLRTCATYTHKRVRAL